MPLTDLNGAVALVTGGASGIGLATVRALGAAGARVVVVDASAERGAAAARQVDGTFVAADVRDPVQVEDAVTTAERTHGRLDVVHLNAGVATGVSAIDALDLDRYREVVSINLDGVFYGARYALGAMRRAGGGSIVVTASLSGLMAHADDPVYCMTKAGVIGLVRALGAQLVDEGITVNAVCPGFVDTPLLGAYTSAFSDAGFPLLTAEEVAAVVLRAATGGGTGEAWVVQPGRDPEPYRFRGVPGPRAEGASGAIPPSLRGDA